MRISVVVGVVVALMTLPSICLAEGVITEPATGAAVSTAGPMLASAPVTGGSMFRMFGGLLFCLGVFGAGIHLSKRYGFAQPKGSKRRMKVIEKMQLTQKSSLILVSCDGRELLLSIGPDQARVLQSQFSANRELFEETFADVYSAKDEEKRCVA